MRTQITLFILLLAGGLFAQDAFRVATVKLTLDGSSNIHDWTSTATEVLVNGQFKANGTAVNAVDGLTVRIPVKKIKSEKGSIMDGKTYDALLASKFPNITFTASRVDVNGDQFKATGTLSIAGKSRTVTIAAKGKAVTGGYEISGAYALKMSEYGIQRPTALMGTISTTDDVTVKFDIQLKR